MLFLLFRLGNDRYALEATQVESILPLIDIKHIPCAPPGVAGAFDYHGMPVPILDVSALLLGHPTPALFSTRIVLVQYRDSRNVTHRLGLIAPGVTETVRLEQEDFVSPGIDNAAAPGLGPVASTPYGLIQRIEINGLLSEAVREVLFREESEVR